MFILGNTLSFFVLLCLASFFGFFSTCPDSTFPDIRLDSTLLQYSPGYDPFCLGFFDTHSDSTPFRYSPRYDLLSGTHPDTILFVLDSPVLARIWSPVCLVFSDTRLDKISSLIVAQIWSFLSWIFRYSPGLDPFSFSLLQHHVRISWSFPTSHLVSFSLLWYRVQIPLAFSGIVHGSPSPFG